MVDVRRLLRVLPDMPCWVETRFTLASGDFLAFADSRREGEEVQPAVIVSTKTPLASILGRPRPETVARFLAAGTQVADVLAQSGDADWAASLLPGWCREEAVLHTLPQTAPLEAPRKEVRLLGVEELQRAALPRRLRGELEEALSRVPVAAAFVGGGPVSFCYASAVTESLWDVSIESLAAWRRRGWAGDCARFMIAWMAGQGKRPVWGALASNTASLRLAEKLGFQAADRLTVFTRTPAIDPDLDPDADPERRRRRRRE